MSNYTGEKVASIIAEYQNLFSKTGDADKSHDTICKKHGLKRETLSRYLRKNAEPKERLIHQVAKDSDLSAQILVQLRKKKSVTLIELADNFSVPPKQIIAAVEELKARHVLINLNTIGELSCEKEIPVNSNPESINYKKHGEVEIPIGFVTDTHLCSKYERLDVLNALYDRFRDYGITDVYHAGNWIDGEARFNKQEIAVHGLGSQVKYFIENYPIREGITTRIISGDDHEGWYVQREGINIGAHMQDEARRSGREDLIDIGYMERDIELQQEDGSAIMRVMHAGGGSAYAISYTSQKYVESLQGGEKPKIILVGHYHKFDYAYPREVHVIQGGCTVDQTTFMRKKRLQAMVGGCVLWIKQARNGVITSLKVEWIPFYDKKFFEYHW